MRGLCSIAAIVASIVVATSDAHAEAESYEPIRFDAGMAGSYVDASSRSGVGFVGEIKYLVHDSVGIGMRIDFEVMFGGKFGNDDVDMSVGVAGAGIAKAEYYVGDGPIRPWVGGGLGVYSIGSQSLSAGPNTAGIDQKAGKYFGVAPQIGIDLGRVRLAATYNMILGADVELRQTIGNVEETVSYSQSYVTFELSFRAGGGRKYKPAPFTPMPPNPPPYVPYGAPPPPAPYPPPPPP